MTEKLDKPKTSLDLIPEPFRIMRQQAIKTCKLNEEMFNMEVNFSYSQLKKL